MDLIKHSVLTPQILAEIRRLHFYTRHIADQGIVGQYRSAFRGQGMEFEEVREYSPGDDVRAIDWKVTAKSRKPYIKLYSEERELTVMIAVDVSGSTLTGTQSVLREKLIAQVGAVLTLIALRNNDKVGLVTYSDKLETFHPPRKGRNAVWRILHEVMAQKTASTKTDLGALCQFLNKVLHRNAITFILSDFIAEGFEKDMSILAKRHDVTAVRISDPADLRLPKCGLVQVQDPESGEILLLDTSAKSTLENYQNAALVKKEEQKKFFAKNKISCLELATNQSFVPALRNYFEVRKARSR